MMSPEQKTLFDSRLADHLSEPESTLCHVCKKGSTSIALTWPRRAATADDHAEQHGRKLLHCSKCQAIDRRVLYCSRCALLSSLLFTASDPS